MVEMNIHTCLRHMRQKWIESLNLSFGTNAPVVEMEIHDILKKYCPRGLQVQVLSGVQNMQLMVNMVKSADCKLVASAL